MEDNRLQIQKQLVQEQNRNLEQQETIRKMKYQMEELQKQNDKLRRDFQRSIQMLEQIKNKKKNKNKNWNINWVDSYYHVRKNQKEQKTPKKRVKRVRRMIGSNRKSSAERYQRTILAEVSTKIETEEPVNTKWSEIQSELDECKGLLNMTPSGMDGKENKFNANLMKKGTNLLGNINHNLTQIDNQEIVSTSNYEYCKEETDDKKGDGPISAINEIASMNSSQNLKMNDLSENDIADIFSKSKKNTGVNNNKSISYDDGLFEYLQQSGHLQFD
jgi:hypothetical protein